MFNKAEIIIISESGNGGGDTDKPKPQDSPDGQQETTEKEWIKNYKDSFRRESVASSASNASGVRQSSFQSHSRAVQGRGERDKFVSFSKCTPGVSSRSFS